MSLKLLIDQYFLTVTNLAPTTIKLRKTILSVFAQFVNYKQEINQSDVIAFFNSERFKHLNESSKNLYRVHLKLFFDYLKLNVDEGLFKKNKIIKKELQKSELLTKTEIRSVLKKMSKPWEKAYFILLYETKARRNEILKLKIKDVVFYDSYAMIYIRSSKSAQRNIPIVESIPYLTRYLEDHPLKNDSEAFLFGHTYKKEFRPLTDRSVNYMIKNRTNFLNKKVYPHLLRHTGLTEMAKYLTEFQLKQLAGWTLDSKQASRYVHLSNEDLENKILELHNLKLPIKEDSVTKIELIECPRCSYKNSDLDKFCSRCGSILDVKTAIEHQQKAAELEQLVDTSDLKKYIDQLFEEKLKKIVKN